MLSINKLLNPALIIPDLRAKTKEEAISTLVDRLFEVPEASGYRKTRKDVYGAVMERENVQTTGIGNEMAFPHARIEGWGKFAIAMAVNKEGLDFGSLDGKPVKVILLMVSSPDEPYIILQAMAAIVRVLSAINYDMSLFQQPAAAERILKMFEDADVIPPEQILARDIARPVINSVKLETSVEDATRMMHLKQADILPVVDENNVYRGEISCLDIFEYGMPDFFKQLNTISFVRHIDPFERYFRIKRNLKVRDIFTGTEPIRSGRTLIEIIFDMTVKHKAKLFVVNDEGVLEGLIDRFCIIDKILFF
ncbi:MAG: PTS sugar transporter subunit IIA [Candidatus Omnitrophota bacterium]